MEAKALRLKFDSSILGNLGTAEEKEKIVQKLGKRANKFYIFYKISRWVGMGSTITHVRVVCLVVLSHARDLVRGFHFINFILIWN